MGKLPYRCATASRSAARLRCAHSGLRLPGYRLGRSSARAAFSRKRAAKSEVPPRLRVTMSSTSSGAGKNSSGWGGSSDSGRRNTMPSSEYMLSISVSRSALSSATTAVAQGACTRAPNGVSTHTRQSPTSST